MATDASVQVVETPGPPEETFYCDVETHPSSRSRRNKKRPGALSRMLFEFP